MGGWEPIPQSEGYDGDATAFVQLPPEFMLEGVPLEAPGHGYVPPMITPLTPLAATDPAATGSWAVQAPLDPQTPQTAEPGEARQDPLEQTASWTIPTIGDGSDALDDSGEYTASRLAQYASSAPPTLPGGAPAPWAVEEPGEPEAAVGYGAEYGTGYGPETGYATGAEAEYATGAPAGMPAGVPVEATREAPVDRSPETPVDLSADHPSGTPGADAPGATGAPSDALSDARSDALSDARSDVLSDGPVDLPAGSPAGLPSDPATGTAGTAGTTGATGATGAPADLTSDLPTDPSAGLPTDLSTDSDEHPHTSYTLRVNGADRPVTDSWIGESLLYVLRERLGLAGAKDGCSQGECGACNVQVDGRLVASCLVPAATAEGCEVRTVEGLAENGEPSDVQRALAKCGVQCGFCIPGMAMTVHDLLEGNHAPNELETRQALCGNLCRCSGYRGVLDAVQEVVEARAAAAEAEAGEEARIPHQIPHPYDGGTA
ncbi:2Fe-2S iron-sulfur cluster-binding protein [Streptomyces sp. NPDC013740]|uniref:2Fe-2S iron-sulfur cluster-binding protein n=1 Tax=Streptomyces sp. NPDC013740 TaxID=3364867 RepID=UPI003700BAEE